MALTIEDGSIVADADSFAEVAEFQAYAMKYGRTIPSGDDAIEALLRRAALQMNGMAWKGSLISQEQCLAWPRSGVCWAGFDVPPNQIPKQIKAGQMALATEIYADDLAPPDQKKGAVIRNKVEGAIEQEFAKADASNTRAAAMRQSTAQFMGFLAGSKRQDRLERA